MWPPILLSGTFCIAIVYTKEKNSHIFKQFSLPYALKLLIDNINKLYCLYFQKMSQILSFPTTYSIIFAEKKSIPWTEDPGRILAWGPWGNKELDMTEWLNTHT